MCRFPAPATVVDVTVRGASICTMGVGTIPVVAILSRDVLLVGTDVPSVGNLPRFTVRLRPRRPRVLGNCDVTKRVVRGFVGSIITKTLRHLESPNPSGFGLFLLLDNI